MSGSLEPDPVNGPVRAFASLRQISAGRHNGQDAPARGHECAVLVDGRARMKDVNLVAALRHALNDVTTAGRPRVALGGHDDGHSVLRAPTESSDVVKLADSRRIKEAAKGCGQSGQNHLGLRVTEPSVELDDPQTARGQGQPDVKHT